MLECGRNFKGSIKMCGLCNEIDDETHRLNYCKKYKNVNNYESDVKPDYNLVYSNDISDLRESILEINKVWNCKKAQGAMLSD